MKTVIFDIETNGLTPDRVWYIVCKEYPSGDEVIFHETDTDRFMAYARGVGTWIGHNILWFDCPVLDKLRAGWRVHQPVCIDTYVISCLLDQRIAGGHSIAAWGERLGEKKVGKDIEDWSQPTELMLERCISDVRVNYLLYKRFLKYITSPVWHKAIEVEHFIASRCRELHETGFHFSLDKAKHLWYTLDEQLKELDDEILRAFLPRTRFVREVVPRLTKHGTLNKSDFRFRKDGDLSDYNGGPFSLIEFEPFNPGSPVQIVERLNEAGWQPTEKTKGHIQAIRDKDTEKIEKFSKVGWTISEENLKTLPDTAPPAAKTLARRIMLASRQRTLTEWINSYRPDTRRIHGSFNGIGAWTHRMSHTNPNTGNIAREDALYGAEMRSMWSADDGHFLVGVDAESIQLRVLAHYIDDYQFTQSLLTGKKEDGTDPHSLNQKALGPICASRNHAKTFVYAWLLGAGIGKVAQILECSYGEASEAVSNFIEFYPGLKKVKNEVIPNDAKKGYFQGFDGRWVKIWGEDLSSRQHFALAGYLQNGEAVIIKHAMKNWYTRLRKDGVPFKICNVVHDEYVTEAPSMEAAQAILAAQCDAIRETGEMLNLRCPMAGVGDIGKTWLHIH